jgi:toxin ParE1/3/4
VKVRYAQKALAQLEQILADIAAENPGAAVKIAARIQRSVKRIAAFPYSCRPTNLSGVRVLPLSRYPYLIFYAVNEEANEIQILRVRHMAQDPNRHLD